MSKNCDGKREYYLQCPTCFPKICHSIVTDKKMTEDEVHQVAEKVAAKYCSDKKEDEKKDKTCGYKCNCKDDWNCNATDAALALVCHNKVLNV